MAIVHNDKFPTNKEICQNEYRLSNKEISFAFPFSLFFKHNNHLFSFNDIKKNLADYHEARKYLALQKGKKFLNIILADHEFLKINLLSDYLKKWINQFEPEILYLHFSSIGSLRFSKSIVDYCKIPYSVHFMDDFYNFNYNKGLLSSIKRRQWRREMREMIVKANLRLAISQEMAEVYSRIFGVHFYHFFNAVNVRKWQEIESQSKDNENFDIIYAGTINVKNIKSLKKFAYTVDKIATTSKKIRFRLFSFQPRLNAYAPEFNNYSKTSIAEVPEGDDIVTLLKSGDLLLLPVDFTDEVKRITRYSMFTKVPAYMASGVPILLWAPDGIAVTEYARREKWAFVLDSEFPKDLKKILYEIIDNEINREIVSSRAMQLSEKRHDSRKISEQFHKLLIRIQN